MLNPASEQSRALCTSGISDKETFVVTDWELGKVLPHRDLEIVQEVQKV